MLRTVYLKSVRDRLVGVSVGVLSLFLTAWMGLWAYAGVPDADSFVSSMPQAYADLLGISKDSGTAGLMMSMMFGFMGAFVISGLTVSIAGASIAGEERDGTMDVLVAIPRSRGRLYRSKALAFLTLVIGGSFAASLTYYVSAVLVGSDISSLNIAAATVHLTTVILVYGALAFALGAGTGNRAMASGITTTVLVISFLGAGLLPMLDNGERFAKLFPWYYIDSASPMINGVDWTQIGILTAIWVALMAVGVVAFVRRDLRAGGVRTSFGDRLRANPRLAQLMGRVQGNGDVSSLTRKAISDRQAVALLAAYGLLVMAIIMAPMYNALADSIGPVVDAMPQALLAMVGFADYSTATGWYHGEMLSITSPAVFAIVAVGAGIALAVEEKRRTISVILGAPVSRRRVAGAKLAALLALVVISGVLLFLGIWAGDAIGGLGIPVSHIAAACLLQVGLGLVFGAAAYAVAGAVGNSSAAAWTGAGVAMGGWAINTFVGVNPDAAWLARFSPFYWALHSFPLDNGMDWTALAVLVGASAVLLVVGLLGYQRRDLRG
jgi:ABC-2 type transport system permease protein